jgi:hypothetical protein
MATYYWVGGNGTWDNSSTTNWAILSGGAGGLGPPTNADTVNFDANSGTAATVTVASTAVSLSTVVNKSDINLSLSGSPTLCTSAGTLTLTTGTLTLNTFTLTVGIFASNNSNARTVAFGTGNITLTGNGTTIWSVATATNFVRSGTPVVNCTYSGATGTRTINHGATAGGSETNCVSYNISAGTDTITFTNSATNAHLNVIFTGFAGTLSNTTWYCYGNLTFSTGMTITAGASSISLNATSGIQQLTTNGKTIDCPMNRGGLGGTLQLQDALTMGSTRTFGLGGGTLDLFGKTLTAGLFTSNAVAVRSILFGGGNITIIGSGGTVWNTANATNFTYTGTPTVNFTYSGSTGTRTLTAHNTGATQATVFNFNFSAGSDTITLTGAFLAKNINFTGFAGTLSNTAINSYGDVTIASGMTLTAGASVMSFVGASVTQLITTNAKTLDFPLTFNGVGGVFQLQDAMTVGSTRTVTLTNGTLNLTGNSGNWTLSTGLFSSANANARAIVFGTGNITITGSGTVWNTGTVTNFSYTGTPTVNVSNNSATATTVTTGALSEAQALTFNYTVGTYTLTDTSSVYKNLNFTGFTGTVPNSARTIYGNLTIVSGATNSAGANATTFAATSGTQQITTNAVTLDYPLTFNGVGGTFAFQDALTQGSTRAFTVTNGTVQLKASATSTVGSFVTSGTNQKNLQSTTSGTQATLSQASGTVSTSYLTVQDIFATGGATWNAFYYNGNLDGGNNTNWIFGESPAYGAEYEYKLRSFTEPRRF